MGSLTSSSRFATITSLLALVVATAGTSYAAVTLPKNSVGKAQLKKNAVVSKKVKDGSLLAQDFAAGQVPQGPPGLPGAKGADGSARAYTTISVDGTVDAELSKGVTQANVERVAVFQTNYATCISGLAFTPKSAVASVEYAGGAIYAPSVQAGIGARGVCPAGTQVTVYGYSSHDNSNYYANVPFSLLLN